MVTYTVSRIFFSIMNKAAITICKKKKIVTNIYILKIFPFLLNSYEFGCFQHLSLQWSLSACSLSNLSY